jgi:hypothetical protein
VISLKKSTGPESGKGRGEEADLHPKPGAGIEKQEDLL